MGLDVDEACGTGFGGCEVDFGDGDCGDRGEGEGGYLGFCGDC